jgi:voltage-gated potassium channel
LRLEHFRPFLLALAVPVVLVMLGTLGYVLIEGWPAFDALYMTVTTMTTVGFMEVHPLSRPGRVFTIFLMLGGVFTLFYAAGDVIRYVVSGEVRRAMGRQRMQKSLEELKGHMVVCGFGRMGHLVCEQFSSLGMPFVVIERSGELLRGFDMPHGIPLAGDATSDDVLRLAGVDRARALVTVAASDADNLYIVMSARFLNEQLFIVARAEEEGAEKKLLRAGANRVVSPYIIGGQRVALAVLRPAVMDFIELAMHKEHLELQIEETRIHPGSRLAGSSLKDSQVRQDLGAIIVAIKKPDGRMQFNPPAEAVIEPGDTLITMGHRQQLDRLESMARA